MPPLIFPRCEYDGKGPRREHRWIVRWTGLWRRARLARSLLACGAAARLAVAQ